MNKILVSLNNDDCQPIENKQTNASYIIMDK